MKKLVKSIEKEHEKSSFFSNESKEKYIKKNSKNFKRIRDKSQNRQNSKKTFNIAEERKMSKNSKKIFFLEAKGNSKDHSILAKKEEEVEKVKLEISKLEGKKKKLIELLSEKKVGREKAEEIFYSIKKIQADYFKQLKLLFEDIEKEMDIIRGKDNKFKKINVFLPEKLEEKRGSFKRNRSFRGVRMKKLGKDIFKKPAEKSRFEEYLRPKSKMDEEEFSEVRKVKKITMGKKEFKDDRRDTSEEKEDKFTKKGGKVDRNCMEFLIKETKKKKKIPEKDNKKETKFRNLFSKRNSSKSPEKKQERDNYIDDFSLNFLEVSDPKIFKKYIYLGKQHPKYNKEMKKDSLKKRFLTNKAEGAIIGTKELTSKRKSIVFKVFKESKIMKFRDKEDSNALRKVNNVENDDNNSTDSIINSGVQKTFENLLRGLVKNGDISLDKYEAMKRRYRVYDPNKKKKRD